MRAKTSQNPPLSGGFRRIDDDFGFVKRCVYTVALKRGDTAVLKCPQVEQVACFGGSSWAKYH